MRCYMLSASIIAILATSSMSLATTIHVPADQPTIQAGIDVAVDGDTVLVADGTYTGDGNRDIDFLGKAIVLKSLNGPELTIIDCEGSSADPHRGFYFHTSEDTLSVLEGFTIMNGWADGNYPDYMGGGIYGWLASPKITNCMIIGNYAYMYGGGIVFWGSTFPDHPKVMNCVISENIANTGGGIFTGSSATITNCTISMNSYGYGGGIYCGSLSYPSISNCIIYDNSLDQINGSGSPGVGYSDVQGGWPGDGNIDEDPLFVNPGNDDYHLRSSSPCINSGDPDYSGSKRDRYRWRATRHEGKD